MAHLGPTLRRNRRREHPAWRALLALAVSLGLNLLILALLDARWLGVGPLQERRAVSLSPLAAADWEANRAVRPAPAQPPAVAPAPEAKAPGQVVDLGDAPASKTPPPRDTRFVSERDHVVEKETRARVTKAPGQQVTPTPVGPVLAEAPGEQGSGERSVPGPPGPEAATSALAAKPGAKPEAKPQADAPLPKAGELVVARAETPKAGAAVAGGQRRSGGDPRLAIPAQTLARLAGGAAPDHLRDVEEGDGTFLNTREWKYASYFNRIKESVGGTWNPRSLLDQRDPDRTIYAFKDRFTLLSVTLDDRGSLKDVSVARSSNVDFLDRSALEAFRKAQPFSNPPSGVVDASGEIRFTFGFYVEVGTPGLRIYRGPAPF